MPDNSAPDNSVPDRRNRVAATALVELAIAIPVLLLTLFVIIELGRFFHQYIILSQIANVAVRTGIQINGMFARCLESPDVLNLGYQINAPTNGELLGHWVAQRRAEVLLAYHLPQLSVEGSGPQGQPELRTEFISDVTTQPSSTCQSVVSIEGPQIDPAVDYGNTFAISITGNYTPMFLAVSIPVRVEARSLMLLDNEQFTIYKGVVSGVPWDPGAGYGGSGFVPATSGGTSPGGGPMGAG